MIKRMFGGFFRLPLQLFRRYTARSALLQLTSHQHPQLKAVGAALYESVTHSVSADAQRLLPVIGQRRASLLNSDMEIAVIDYGVNSPNSKRTKEAMKKGVQSTALVADICESSMSAFWATVLFKLIRKLEPLSCVELGACVGISASYQAAALNFYLKGNLRTL